MAAMLQDTICPILVPFPITAVAFRIGSELGQTDLASTTNQKEWNDS